LSIDAQGNGEHQGEHCVDRDAQEARTDVPNQGAVLDSIETGLRHRVKMRKQTGIDVEVRDQDRP
jgi:hypothetical protein